MNVFTCQPPTTLPKAPSARNFRPEPNGSS